MRKMRFRVAVFLNARYRKSTWGQGQETFENVSQSGQLFGRPTILIVGALDLPQCKKYRVSQKVEYFQSIGWDCHYCHYNDAQRTVSYLQISTALIFYRVPSCAQFTEYLGEAARLGVKTFYDIDDPIFNEAVYGENKNLEHMAQEDFGGRTYLWKNLVDSATLSIVRNLESERVERDIGRVVIGYASGSRAHDEDFKTVAKALADVLNLYEHVELQVIGYVVMPPELEPFKDRINTRPFTGYVKYFEALSRIDINIVPLVEDRFNACKSAIRYLEASLCRVPTVAASVGQFSEIIDDGQDGHLAKTNEDFGAGQVNRESRSEDKNGRFCQRESNGVSYFFFSRRYRKGTNGTVCIVQ